MKVRRLRSGRIAAPPGPRKRSRRGMSPGVRPRTGVPRGASFFFFSFPFWTAAAGSGRLAAKIHAKTRDRQNPLRRVIVSPLHSVLLPPDLLGGRLGRDASQTGQLVDALAQRADVAVRH